MRKLFVILIALTLSSIVVAQDNTKVKEVGLTFRNLDNFGFSYKVGTEQSLWRFNAISISGSSNSQSFEDDDDDIDSNHFGFGFSAGKEYRKLIAKNLEYRYGFDFSFNYSHSKRTQPSYSQYSQYDTAESDFYTPGFNLVFGVNYIVSKHLVLGAELMPYLNYTFGESSTGDDDYDKEITDHSNFSYGFNSSSVLLSVAYRF